MSFRHIRWAEMESEQLKPGLTRQFTQGEQVTVGRVFLKKGTVVHEHQHVNEQVSLVLEGALEFRFGNATTVLRPGETLLIPPNLPHEATALEDTWNLDVFYPVRADWISGDDAYIRKT